jgi:flagellar assembly protein FliH
MSSKAHRVMGEVHRFPWRPRGASTAAAPVKETPVAGADVGATLIANDKAAIEREAFARGYEQGERDAAAAARAHTEAVLNRVAETLQELAGLRRAILRDAERDMVQLSLAIAQRVVRREVFVDREVVVAIARVALDRLGERQGVTVRLHPDDHAYAVARHGTQWAGEGITVIADADVPAGGCRVTSPGGTIDTGIDAQFAELARGMLPEGDARSSHAA